MCRDKKSKFRIGFLLPNHGYLLRYLKQLCLLVKQKRRKIKTFRIDSEFFTNEINTFCANEQIELLPCIPYEHETLPNVERDHRTMQEAIVKDLKAKPHLTFRYWAMAYFDVFDKMNITPTHDNLTTTPFELWNDRKSSNRDNPAIPFGSIVMAWIPLEDQTSLGGRSVETYYVGMATGYKGGILLYNPVTKRTIVRRSFKIMGPAKQAPSVLELEALENKPLNIEQIYNNNIPKVNELPVGAPHDDVIEEELPDLTGDENDDEYLDIIDSEDEDAVSYKNNESKTQEEYYKNNFGNDITLEADPSDKAFIQHIPKISKTKKLKPDEFYVEKIINHKGTTDKKSSMKFFVKWVGYDDTHNSWIPWKEAKDLAVLDTYLQNVDILLPVEKAYNSSRIQNTAQDIENTRNLPYIINYVPPKACRGAISHDAYLEFMDLPPYFAYASKASFSKDIPKSFTQIPKMPDSQSWYNATLTEVKSFHDNNVFKDLPSGTDISTIDPTLILLSMLIYDKQYNPDGTFKKYKARLVITGDKWFDI